VSVGGPRRSGSHHRPGPGCLRGRCTCRRRAETRRTKAPAGRASPGHIPPPASPARTRAPPTAGQASDPGHGPVRRRSDRELRRRVPGLRATSPRCRQRARSNRVESYRRFLTSRMTSIADSISRTVRNRILRTSRSCTAEPRCSFRRGGARRPAGSASWRSSGTVWPTAHDHHPHFLGAFLADPRRPARRGGTWSSGCWTRASGPSAIVGD
jgi:hypothetical protein